VPPELQTTAEQLLAQINPGSIGDANPFSGKLQIIVEPGLSNVASWFLIADPAKSDGLALSYLGGQSAPTVESREDWSTLSTSYRLVWSLDARIIEHRSWFRNPGA